MKVAAAKATTDCRLDERDLHGTTVRWEKLLTDGPCPHQHLAKGVPPCGMNVAVYVLMDSNCHSGWEKCDKGEGNWLWFIACDRRKSGTPVSVGIKVRSLEPALLELRAPDNEDPLVTDEYEMPIPLWLCPYYGKSERSYCEKSYLEVIRHSTYEFRRAPLEMDIRIKMDRAREEQVREQRARIAVMILPPDDSVGNTRKEKAVAKRFLRHLVKGGIKSIPVVGGLLEEVIFGTLDAEEAAEEATKLNNALGDIYQKMEGQSIVLNDVLSSLQSESNLRENIRYLVGGLRGFLVSGKQESISQEVERAVQNLLIRHGEVVDYAIGGKLDELDGVIERLTEALSRVETGAKGKGTEKGIAVSRVVLIKGLNRVHSDDLDQLILSFPDASAYVAEVASKKRRVIDFVRWGETDGKVGLEAIYSRAIELGIKF